MSAAKARRMWGCAAAAAALVAGAAAGPARAGDTNRVLVSSSQPAVTLDLSLRNEAHAGVARALDWLASRQRGDGAWSDPSLPALTGLPLWAFALTEHPRKEPVVKAAVRFILSCVRDDGGIYLERRDGSGGMPTYNTAICMAALHATGDPALTPVVLKARRYIAGTQHFGGDVYDAGMGYDRESGKAYTDLLNSVTAFEAMRLTQSAEGSRANGERHADIDWEKARAFLKKLQESAPGSAATGSVARAAETNRAVALRSYGSMTYAGMLAMIYADVNRDDPRVRSAFDWSREHWELDENPGMGRQGLFFFYHVLTKALSAYGADRIPGQGNRDVNWRAEVAAKLLSLQRTDPKTGHGYWVNEAGRFREDDAVLVTAYAVLALEIIGAR